MMTINLAKTKRSRMQAAGFTLVEILISLGIFLIGMTAIVSLFPAAAILQRETTREVISEMAAQSAKSVINANKLTYATGSGDLGNYPTAGYRGTDAVPLQRVMGNTAFLNRFPAAVRSYPTGLLNGTNIDECDLHWVPFIQNLSGDLANPNWVMRLFIVESDSRATYTIGVGSDANLNDPTNFPKVRGVPISRITNSSGGTGDVFQLSFGTQLEASDILMDSNGNSHVVIDVTGNNIQVLNSIPQTPLTPNKIWYTPRGGASSSPAQRVITVEVDVVSP